MSEPPLKGGCLRYKSPLRPSIRGLSSYGTSGLKVRVLLWVLDKRDSGFLLFGSPKSGPSRGSVLLRRVEVPGTDVGSFSINVTGFRRQGKSRTTFNEKLGPKIPNGPLGRRRGRGWSPCVLMRVDGRIERKHPGLRRGREGLVSLNLLLSK